MKRAFITCCLILALGCLARADSTIRITDVGLHGYVGTPTAVRLYVRNPSPQSQTIRIRVTEDEATWNTVVSRDIQMQGGEERQFELPVLMPYGDLSFKATATVGGALIGVDHYRRAIQRQNVLALLCDNDDVCKKVQSQIQFSGSIEDRADKNRELRFEIVNDFREDWWGYSGVKGIVLAMPLSKLQPQHLQALEGYLRRGGRLVLIEPAIADSTFLAAYRQGSPNPDGTRVGKGVLFRVQDVEKVGNVFTGYNLPAVLNPQDYAWLNATQENWLSNRYGTTFDFPGLGWLLIALAVYILVIGVLNFFVLRRLRLLEFGWVSTLVLALLFAAGFYYSSASKRPKAFRLDNLTTYFLDSNSGLAAADASLRLSTPDRQQVKVAIDDPAVLVTILSQGAGEGNGQIWAEINRTAVRAQQQYDIDLGPPQRVELPMLKWSSRDLSLLGLRQFPGTVHVVAPNRLRNDTGQTLLEPVYADYDANAIYTLPTLAPGQEIGLDTIASRPIRTPGQPAYLPPDTTDPTLSRLAITTAGRGPMFFAVSDGPALPVELNVQHERNVHSLIVVNMEQP